MPERMLTLCIQAILSGGIISGWFYLVDKKIVNADSLETFLGTAGGAVIAYFFHQTIVKGDKTP